MYNFIYETFKILNKKYSVYKIPDSFYPPTILSVYMYVCAQVCVCVCTYTSIF